MLQVKQRSLTRTVETRDFSPSGSITLDLPMGYDQDSVLVRLSGVITIGTAPSTYHTHMIPRLVSRIDIFSNGKNKFHEVTGLMACLGNFERANANTLTDLAAGTGAKTVDAYFRIDNVNPDGPRPKDSSLHTAKPFMSKMQIKVQFGAYVDMVLTAGAFAVTSHALTCEVMVEETIEFEDAAYFEDRLVKVQSIIEETVDATKTSHRVKLATGELLLRGVKVYALDETGALSNAVINSAQIKSGVDVAYFKSGSAARESNKAHYNLQGSQQVTGFYYFDLCPKGQLNQLWDTRGRSELDLVLDVTKPAGGDAKLVVVPVQFYEQDNAGVRSNLGLNGK